MISPNLCYDAPQRKGPGKDIPYSITVCYLFKSCIFSGPSILTACHVPISDWPSTVNKHQTPGVTNQRPMRACRLSLWPPLASLLLRCLRSAPRPPACALPSVGFACKHSVSVNIDAVDCTPGPQVSCTLQPSLSAWHSDRLVWLALPCMSCAPSWLRIPQFLLTCTRFLILGDK